MGGGGALLLHPRARQGPWERAGGLDARRGVRPGGTGCLSQHPHRTPCLQACCELRRNKLLEKSLPAAKPNLSCQSGACLPALIFSTIDLLDCRNIKNLKLLVLITTSWRLHHSMCLAVLRGRLAPSLALGSYRASLCRSSPPPLFHLPVSSCFPGRAFFAAMGIFGGRGEVQ